MQPGSIVRCRKRDWVLLPSDQPDVVLLRPLAGASDQVVAIHRRLADLVGYTLPESVCNRRRFHYPLSIRLLMRRQSGCSGRPPV